MPVAEQLVHQAHSNYHRLVRGVGDQHASAGKVIRYLLDPALNSKGHGGEDLTLHAIAWLLGWMRISAAPIWLATEGCHSASVISELVEKDVQLMR